MVKDSCLNTLESYLLASKRRKWSHISNFNNIIQDGTIIFTLERCLHWLIHVPVMVVSSRCPNLLQVLLRLKQRQTSSQQFAKVWLNVLPDLCTPDVVRRYGMLRLWLSRVVKYFVYIVVPRLSYDHRVVESTQVRIFSGTIGMSVGGSEAWWIYLTAPCLGYLLLVWLLSISYLGRSKHN